MVNLIFYRTYSKMANRPRHLWYINLAHDTSDACTFVVQRSGPFVHPDPANDSTVEIEKKPTGQLLSVACVMQQQTTGKGKKKIFLQTKLPYISVNTTLISFTTFLENVEANSVATPFISPGRESWVP